MNKFPEDVPEGSYARSVGCQLQDVLFILLAHDGEAAFLQDPDGGDVVLGNTRVEGAAYLHVAKEYTKRLRGDSLAPVLPPDPVADLQLAVLLEAHHVGSCRVNRRLPEGKSVPARR